MGSEYVDQPEGVALPTEVGELPAAVIVEVAGVALELGERFGIGADVLPDWDWLSFAGELIEQPAARLVRHSPTTSACIIRPFIWIGFNYCV